MSSSKTAPVSQYALKEKDLIDATITLRDTQLEIAGRINSENVTKFLRNSMSEEFSGWIKFNITVSPGEGSKLSLDQNGHTLTLGGKVENCDLKGLHARLEKKQEGAVSIATLALHKLAGEDPRSTVLDRLSDIFAEEVKKVGHATEIRPRAPLEKLRSLLRHFS